MLKEKVGDFERIVKIVDGYDRRTDGYGIKDATISFALKGHLGAVSFVIRTGLYPNNTGGVDERAEEMQTKLTPLEVTTHSYMPRWEQEEPAINKCAFLDDKPCYSNTSFITAIEPFNILMNKGIESLWGWLEKHYDKMFSEPIYIPIHYAKFQPLNDEEYIVRDYMSDALGFIFFDKERWYFRPTIEGTRLTEGQMKKIADFVEDINNYQ